jgi:hypothetical protein
MPRPTALAACALLALAGCGADEAPLDEGCLESSEAIVRALGRAPSPVALGSGARLSECVSNARRDSELQNAGIVLTRAADDLAVRAERGDARAAVGLGYLVGAARRGAARTSGIHAELLRRVERAAAYVEDGGDGGALRRGLRAGEATG